MAQSTNAGLQAMSVFGFGDLGAPDGAAELTLFSTVNNPGWEMDASNFTFLAGAVGFNISLPALLGNVTTPTVQENDLNFVQENFTVFSDLGTGQTANGWLMRCVNGTNAGVVYWWDFLPQPMYFLLTGDELLLTVSVPIVQI